jgi:hypothetical protein
MTVNPELVAIVGAFAGAVIVALPGLHRALARRRQAQRACVQCGWSLVVGQRTCDCDDE